MVGVLDDYATVTWEVCLRHKLALLSAMEVEDSITLVHIAQHQTAADYKPPTSKCHTRGL
jgi:hypothetical protein